MVDIAPPEKRMRYNLRNAPKVEEPKKSRYMLRSTAKRDGIVIKIKDVELPRRRKTQSNKSNPKQLMDVNSDCLLKMLEYMGPYDLSNLAETNKRFYDLAQYQFWRKYRTFNCTLLLEDDGLVNLEKFERVLRIFGHHIVSLTVSMFLFVEEADTSLNLLLLISRYCGANMNFLSLDGFILTEMLAGDAFSARLKDMFNRIEHLVFMNGWIDWTSDSMKKLKTLKLMEVDSHWNFLSLKLPAIKEFQLMFMDYIESEILSEFLEINTSIRYLSIVQCFGISSSMYKTIGKMNLKELEFQQYGVVSEELFQRDLNYISSLKKLKTLKINCMKHSVSSFLAKLVRNDVDLVHLELSNGLFDTDTFENINKLKKLKILKFNEMIDITNSFIMGMAKQLHSLTEFHIKSYGYITRSAIRTLVRDLHQLECLKVDTPYFELDLDTYNEMLSVIQKRTNKKHVKLTIYDSGDNEQMLVPRTVINGPNQKWLQIQVLDRRWNYVFPFSAMDEDDENFDFFDDDD